MNEDGNETRSMLSKACSMGVGNVEFSSLCCSHNTICMAFFHMYTSNYNVLETDTTEEWT